MSCVQVEPVEARAGPPRWSPGGSSGILCVPPQVLVPYLARTPLCFSGICTGAAGSVGLVSFVSGPLFLRLSKKIPPPSPASSGPFMSLVLQIVKQAPGKHVSARSAGWAFPRLLPLEKHVPRNPTLSFRSFWGIRVKIQDQSFLSPLGGVSHLSLRGLPSPLMGVSNFPLGGVSFSP